MNLPSGASVWPCSRLPQHVTVRLVRMPQVCHVPAVTAVNSPSGASASPREPAPQQVTVSSVRTAHERSEPLSTAL